MGMTSRINMSDLDLQKAAQKAAESKNADALIQVQWHEEYHFYVFFSYKKYIVTGEAVKLVNIDEKK
jgi:hypothetical protein